jgi:hypothetical protein
MAMGLFDFQTTCGRSPHAGSGAYPGFRPSRAFFHGGRTSVDLGTRIPASGHDAFIGKTRIKVANRDLAVWTPAESGKFRALLFFSLSERGASGELAKQRAKNLSRRASGFAAERLFDGAKIRLL